MNPKKRTLIGTAGILGLLLGVASQLCADDLAIDFDWQAGRDSPRGELPRTVGWTFTALSPVMVTHLAFWQGTTEILYHGNGLPHRVGLWDQEGNLLAVSRVGVSRRELTSRSGNRFWIEPISPVRLQAGRNYRIGMELEPNVSLAVFVTRLNGAPVVDPAIAYGGPAQGGFRMGLSFPFPVATTDSGYFGPDFLIESIPEPPPWALMLFAGWVFAGVRGLERRRK